MNNEDFFQILGVERRFDLSEEALERNFHERSKLYHPDRHAMADPRTRVRNALATSNLNQAYRTLRDPTARASYLLTVEGIDAGDEGAGGAVDPMFLAEIMELREALMDARMESDVEKVNTLTRDMRQRRQAALEEIAEGFRRFETEKDRGGLETAAGALASERYFRRFLDEAEAFLEEQAGDAW